MRAFVAVITAGSFKGAGERLGMSTALVSKYVSHLEGRLGARLINRTTRSLSITEIGEVYFQRCQQLLDDVDDLEAVVLDQAVTPKGSLRVTAPRTFGELYLAPLVGEFVSDHPDVSVKMDLNDRFVNIVDEGFDLAIRIGELEDSSLYARKISQTRLCICAAPQYLADATELKAPKDLAHHNCVIDINRRNADMWPLMENGRVELFKVQGHQEVNSALASRQMVLSGVGLALIPEFAVKEDIQEGSLVEVLEQYNVPSIGIYAVYPHNRHLANKVRVFVDFLSARLPK